MSVTSEILQLRLINKSKIKQFHSSSVSNRSKENRQRTYVKRLLDFGVNYVGSLSEAKSTLNRFLRNDASHLGVVDIGNGNNRNISDRLEPILQKECQKYNLPDYGDYYQLRVRLKDKKPFNTFLKIDDFANISKENVNILTQNVTQQVSQQESKKSKKPEKSKPTKPTTGTTTASTDSPSTTE